MSKIEIEHYGNTGFGCQSEDCMFRRECSQHHTAGDFRSEDGFTPELFMDKSGIVDCQSKDRKPLNSYDAGCVPDNYDQLKAGSLSLNDLKNTIPVLFSQLSPGEKFRYAGEIYTKVDAHLLVVSDGIKTVLKEKNLFVSKRGHLLTVNPDFLVVKL